MMKIYSHYARKYGIDYALKRDACLLSSLNATGYTYSYEELDAFRKSENHKLLIAGLEDKYGTYGKIGLVLVECKEEFWTFLPASQKWKRMGTSSSSRTI